MGTVFSAWDPELDRRIALKLMHRQRGGSVGQKQRTLVEARSQIKQMIDEQAMLRREVGLAQESEARAKRLRDEAQDEVERLHDVIAKLGQDKESLAAKVEELGKELLFDKSCDLT